jgi:hypothetical protein
MPLLEISISLPNRAGTLAGVARTLAREKMNLAAISVDSTRTRGRVRLIVSDPERARRLLEEAGYTVETREMIAIRMEDRAGSFLRVLEVLASENISVNSVAILTAREGNQVLVALSANDLRKARKALVHSGFPPSSVQRLLSNADLGASAPVIPSESVGLML